MPVKCWKVAYWNAKKVAEKLQNCQNSKSCCENFLIFFYINLNEGLYFFVISINAIIAVDNLWNKGPVLKVVKCPAAKHVLKVH